ncbi:MAG TPA: CHASE3 domain-containing protein [Acidimicrobiales bacterium]|nr:CHASE3 domain-containing protein [Acidimicrobiales bacterium]
MPARRAPRSMRWLATTLVAVLVALLLANSAATLYARILVSRAQAALDHQWLRSQTDASKLLSAYVDQETAERGFLLTGNAIFLQPYAPGAAAATRLQRQLAAALATDAPGTALLHQVVAAHAAWRQLSGAQIAAKKAGTLSDGQIDAGALRAKTLFDSLRAKLARLSERTSFLIRSELRHISAAQSLADVVTAVTVALALFAGSFAIPVTRRVLTRPLALLLAQLQRVERGDYQRTVRSGGAAELVEMAKSADQMRQSLLRHSDEVAQAQRTLTLRGERDRLAADLHDRSIQRMFALGLSLSSLSKRHPELSPDLGPLVDETDRGIRELRGIVFNLTRDDETTLRHGIDQMVRESVRALGFAPEVEVRGPVDQVADESLVQEFLAVLREALSNVARHAHASGVQITVSTDGDGLRLVVSDNGVGLSEGPPGHGIRNMEARATRLGGTFDLRPGAAGTVLEWGVPVGRHSGRK